MSFLYLKSQKSKKRLYFIKDNYLNFWFKFIYPNKSSLEEGEIENVLNKIIEKYPEYFSQIFEKICRKVIVKKFSFNRIGKQWGKTYRGKETYEIDILALNEKTKEILFAECKWRNNVNAENIAKKLEEKTKNIDWNTSNRKEIFVIFAKSFKKKIEEYEGRRVYCYDLKDLERILF